MDKIYKVDGMTCGGCSSAVRKALERAFPQAEVTVSLEEGTALIRGEHEEQQALEAIENAGFAVAV